MKKISYIITFLWLFVACSDYNDSNIQSKLTEFQERIQQIQAKVAQLNQSIEQLSQLTNGNVITSVSTDAEGKYIISYVDGQGKEKTLVVASQNDVVEAPILGVKQSTEDGIYYWTLTIEGTTSWMLNHQGKQVPVSGHTPSLSVNADGYWVVDGQVLTDSYGNPIEATTDNSALFKQVYTSTDGYLHIELGNGEALSFPIFNSLNLVLDSPSLVTVPGGTTGISINYSVTGTQAAQAIVSINYVEGLTASIDSQNKILQVQFPAGFSGGQLILSAYDLDKLVLRPLVFVAQ